MSEQIYYKVENKDSELFKNASEFLAMEDRLREEQKAAVIAKVPKFKTYRGEKGFDRIVRFTGFVFEDPQNIDPKVWITKEVDGKMLSTPNRRTNAGREMWKFLNSFERTTMWDVDRLLGIGKESVFGSFYPANLFKFNERIYIFIDSQFREAFEKNNMDIIEITHGEITKAIDDYNKD